MIAVIALLAILAVFLLIRYCRKKNKNSVSSSQAEEGKAAAGKTSAPSTTTSKSAVQTDLTESITKKTARFPPIPDDGSRRPSLNAKKMPVIEEATQGTGSSSSLDELDNKLQDLKGETQSQPAIEKKTSEITRNYENLPVEKGEMEERKDIVMSVTAAGERNESLPAEQQFNQPSVDNISAVTDASPAIENTEQNKPQVESHRLGKISESQEIDDFEISDDTKF